MKELTKSEEILLLAIWRLKEDAYGVKIRENISKTTSKTYTFGTLYSTLEQLVKKEYVTKTPGEPTAERGGRRKIYYKVSPEGMKALKTARELERTIWDGISDFVFDHV